MENIHTSTISRLPSPPPPPRLTACPRAPCHSTQGRGSPLINTFPSKILVTRKKQEQTPKKTTAPNPQDLKQTKKGSK